MRQATAKVIPIERTAFETSRDLDFFTEAGLVSQVGYGPELWPIVVAKELIDNALDACESKDIAPEIVVTLAANSLEVADNGPGIPAHIIERSVNYKSRISDKRHYVSPTRGQLGNALKCIWAIPFVASGNKSAMIEVTACGVRHRITVSLDHIRQEPDIRITVEPSVQNGTSVKVHWPEIARLTVEPETMDLYKGAPVADALHMMIAGFAALNPHATFRLKLPRGKERASAASNPSWQKWRSSQPTSAHWYTPEHLRDLIAAHVSRAEKDGAPACSVREFVSGFDGLRRPGSQKLVTEEAGLSRHSLNELVQDRGLPLLPIAGLLDALKKHSRPVVPKRLGVIGEEHLRASFKAQGVAPGSFKYKKFAGCEDGLPYVVEVAFGMKDESGRRLHLGLNFSPSFKTTSDDLANVLSKCHVREHDPVVLLIHQCCPRFAFADSGKGTVANDENEEGIMAALTAAIEKVTAEFKKEKRRRIAQVGAQEDEELKQDARDRLCRKKQSRDEIKATAYKVMEEAYKHTSDYGKMIAHARQIMYSARDRVLALIGKCWDNSEYFTQKLLPDYVKEHPDETKGWDVVFDARGHLSEPHVREIIPLGTLEVRNHVRTWDHRRQGLEVEIDDRYPTRGPQHRYRFALYIEKEGFDPLLRQVQIAERYDLAIFSSKGFSSTAARQLVDQWAAWDVTILVLHDFDIDGLGIAHTLTNDTRRYEFKTTPKVIDLGLRLEDVRAMNLQSESWENRRLAKHPAERLLRYGASQEEINYLVNEKLSKQNRFFCGERVELNAMTSPQFIRWLESKLDQYGVTKVIPDAKTLQKAYRHAQDGQRLRASLAAIQANPYQGPVPKNLHARVIKRLAEHPELSWDQAVRLEVEEN